MSAATGGSAPLGAVEVVAASAATAGAAATVMARAFAQDATVATLVPLDVPGREDRLQRLFLAEIHSAGFDRVDLAVDAASQEVLGVAAWERPPRGREAELPLSEVTRWRLVAARALGPGGVIAGRRFDKATERLRPPEPHWHLMDIAVDPHAQGRGVGGALLSHRLALVDADGKRAYLSATTPASRRLYERHGFEAVGSLPEGTGGATAMVRRPVIRI